MHARPSGQVRARDCLGVACAWATHVGGQTPGVGAPMISVVAGEPEGLTQRCERPKDLILAATTDGGQDLAGVVIEGMPQPAWVALVADQGL